ncbi:MAG: DNA-processing protein DprA [Treponema sp.]|nr:DNA-processing protein DprA [Treponema sp.]
MAERGLLDLIIARLPGLSFPEKIVLCESLESEQDLILRSRQDIEVLIGRRLNTSWDFDLIRMLAERDAHTAYLWEISWVSWRSPEYPPMLREIYDPPPVLFFRGSLPNSEKPLVGVVGTRKPSPMAVAHAFDLSRDLGYGGVSVVSGLALGIDAVAHRGNMEGGASTFAVLGSGVDEIYPASNRALARRVLETGGALISEYPPGTGPRKWNFPARNRIVSGLCRGVLIVEAPEKSGALITARFALEQNRELWVASTGVARDPDSGMKAQFDRTGTQRLAEDGAEVVYSASDIFEMWNMGVPDPDHCREPGDAVTARAAVLAEASSLACSLGITL